MKTFSNLYSAIKHGRNIIIRPKWKPNVPGHNYYVSKMVEFTDILEISNG